MFVGEWVNPQMPFVLCSAESSAPFTRLPNLPLALEYTLKTIASGNQGSQDDEKVGVAIKCILFVSSILY